MHDSQFRAPLDRRGALARLAGVALSLTGLTAFRRSTTQARVAAPKWDDRFELAVDLEIAPQQGYRYHRPYVAVWVEDANGKPVRTLSVWVNTSGRGPRYIRELRRWFTMERDQEDAGGPDLITTVSSATRLPGQYTVTWNGRDDRGNVVDQGAYRVVIEAAREHGTYQLMRQVLDISGADKQIDVPIKGIEITAASLDYHKTPAPAK